MSNSELIGGIGIMGFISPMSTEDTYPVVDPLYGVVGLRNVDTIDDLIETMKVSGHLVNKNYFIPANFDSSKSKLLLCEVVFINGNQLCVISGIIK